jgi:hypothetical protein
MNQRLAAAATAAIFAFTPATAALAQPVQPPAHSVQAQQPSPNPQPYPADQDNGNGGKWGLLGLLGLLGLPGAVGTLGLLRRREHQPQTTYPDRPVR